MFNKVLIINCEDRAIHVLRVCREVGVRSDANFLYVDCGRLHGGCAGEKVNGSLVSRKSYLNFIKVLKDTEDEVYVTRFIPVTDYWRERHSSPEHVRRWRSSLLTLPQSEWGLGNYIL